MREIKFRAWVKKENKMIFGKQALAVKKFTSDYAYLNNEVEVMQYTDLKVNCDVELYEGDIIEVKGSVYYGWKQGREYFKANAVVVYDENEMRYRFLAHTEKFGKQYVDFDKSIRQSYKIIGNIYENPELLEEN